MFIKTIVKTEKKTGKRYNYYRLCESYRIGNKIRHRSIVSMGRLDGIETREDKKLLADTIEALIHGETRLAFFDAGPEIARYAKEFANRIIDEKLLDIQPMATEPEYKLNGCVNKHLNSLTCRGCLQEPAASATHRQPRP